MTAAPFPRSAQAALSQSALAFELGLCLNRETGPRDRLEAALGYGFTRQFANTIRILLDPFEGFFDLVDGVLIRREQAQREIAVEIVRAGVSHVQAVTGHFFGGFLGQAVHLEEESFAEFQEILVILGPFGFNLNLTTAGDGDGLVVVLFGGSLAKVLLVIHFCYANGT